jgi:hypothetical protein
MVRGAVAVGARSLTLVGAKWHPVGAKVLAPVSVRFLRAEAVGRNAVCAYFLSKSLT